MGDSAPSNLPGLGLYSSVREPRWCVVVLIEPQTWEMWTIISDMWKAYNSIERIEGYNYNYEKTFNFSEKLIWFLYSMNKNALKKYI